MATSDAKSQSSHGKRRTRPRLSNRLELRKKLLRQRNKSGSSPSAVLQRRQVQIEAAAKSRRLFLQGDHGYSNRNSNSLRRKKRGARRPGQAAHRMGQSVDACAAEYSQ